MLQNNFIYAQAKALFQTELEAGNILNTAIVFLADTGEIWTHGKYFATSLSAEEIENIITSSETIEEFIKQVSPAEVAISTTEPVNDEKIWIDPSDAEDTFVSSALPAAVTELTSSSSSEDIISAFGGAPEFDRILTQVRELNNVGFITVNNDTTGGRIPATVTADKTNNQLTISYVESGKLVTMVVTNTDGTFSCVVNEAAIGSEAPDLSNYLAKDNATEFTPTSDYNPATKKYVDDSISAQTTNIISQITDSAPETLDTLNELAAALGDDPNFATTVTNQIAGKANSVHTHAITDVTGLVNNGDGNSFLANDGTYKEIASSNQYLDMTIFNGSSGTLNSDDYQKVVDAYNNKVAAGYGGGQLLPISIMYTQQMYVIISGSNIPDSEDGSSTDAINIHFAYIVVRESDKGFNSISDHMTLKKSGDGTQFLADDGTYKAVSGGSSPYIYNLPNEFYQALASEQKVSFTITSENIQSLKNAINSNTEIVLKFEVDGINMAISPCMASYNGLAIEIHFSIISGTTSMYAIYIYIAEDGSQSTIEAFKIAEQSQLSDASDLNISTVDPESFSEDISGYFNGENSQYGIRRFFIVSDFVITVCSGVTGEVKCGDLKRLPDGSIVEFYVDSVYNNPDYTYTLKCKYVERVLTESEYSALGTTPETDNVLYFVTPD